MSVPQRDLPPILQGATWEVVIRWESDTLTYKAISTISQAAPGIVTSVTHGLPPDWRVAIVGAKGMRQVNARRDPPGIGDFFQAKVESSTQIALPYATSSFPAYTGGGSLVFRAPKVLTGYTARMQLRSAVESTGVPIFELTTANSRIAIDTVNYKITLTIAATDTATLNFDSCAYDLEMVSNDPTPIVTRILQGRIALNKEVTRA